MTFNIKSVLSKLNGFFSVNKCSSSLKSDEIQMQMRRAQYRAGVWLKK